MQSVISKKDKQEYIDEALHADDLKAEIELQAKMAIELLDFIKVLGTDIEQQAYKHLEKAMLGGVEWEIQRICNS